MSTNQQGDLTVEQVAAELQVSVSTVYKMLRSGLLKSYRTGDETGSYRVTRAALDQFREGER